jgi:hypothetical protein
LSSGQKGEQPEPEKLVQKPRTETGKGSDCRLLCKNNIRTPTLITNNLWVLMRSITGPCRLSKHLQLLGISNTAECRFCQEAEESSLHPDQVWTIHSTQPLLGNQEPIPKEVENIPSYPQNQTAGKTPIDPLGQNP